MSVSIGHVADKAAGPRPTHDVVLHSSDGLDDVLLRVVPIAQDLPVHVGRSSRNVTKGIMAASDNLYIDSPVVSREHALLTLDCSTTPTVYITDTGSMHGTKLNGREIHLDDGPQRLTNGDTLQFGVNVVRDHATYIAKEYKYTLEPRWIPPAPASTAAPASVSASLFPKGVSVPSEGSASSVSSDDDLYESDEAAWQSRQSPAAVPRSSRLPRNEALKSTVDLTGEEDSRRQVITIDDDEERPPSPSRTKSAAAGTDSPLPRSAVEYNADASQHEGYRYSTPGSRGVDVESISDDSYVVDLSDEASESESESDESESDESDGSEDSEHDGDPDASRRKIMGEMLKHAQRESSNNNTALAPAPVRSTTPAGPPPAAAPAFSGSHARQDSEIPFGYGAAFPPLPPRESPPKAPMSPVYSGSAFSKDNGRFETAETGPESNFDADMMDNPWPREKAVATQLPAATRPAATLHPWGPDLTHIPSDDRAPGESGWYPYTGGQSIFHPMTIQPMYGSSASAFGYEYGVQNGHLGVETSSTAALTNNPAPFVEDEAPASPPRSPEKTIFRTKVTLAEILAGAPRAPQRATTTSPEVEPAPTAPASSAPAPSVPAPSVPAPSVPAPSVSAPTAPAPSAPVPSAPAPSLKRKADVLDAETNTTDDASSPVAPTPLVQAKRPRKNFRRAVHFASTVAASMAVGAVAVIGGLAALPDGFFE